MIDLDTFQKGMNVSFPNLSTLVAAKSRIYRLFKKKFNFKGETALWRPVVDMANGSNDYTTSRAYAAGPVPLEARFGFKRDYAHIKLDIEAIMASQGDGASAPVQEVATKSALLTHALQIKLQLLRNGGNARGVIASGHGTPTITLVNKEDAFFFLPNMWLQGASDDGAQASPAGLRDSGAAAKVGKVNLQLGQITSSTGANWNSLISGLTSGDSLFRRGDYGATGPNGFFGLDAWFPSTDPGASDSFGGLNRSIAPDKLAGMRVDVGGNILDGLFDVLAEMQQNLDDENVSFTVIMSLKRSRELMSSVQTQTKYEPGDAAKFGASSFTIVLPWGGKCTVVAETGMAQDRFYVGVPDTFEILARQGDIPHWQNADQRVWRHLGDSDSIEAYIHSYIATRCEKPNLWAVGLIS